MMSIVFKVLMVECQNLKSKLLDSLNVKGIEFIQILNKVCFTEETTLFDYFYSL